MNKGVAIEVNNVSKTFVIPHEKISTLRGAFVSALRKKSYEKFSALKNVSFEVRKGEFFGIIGRNGSGKSTLLKILAGIYTANQGRVEVNGRISPFLELGIGFNPELSGRDNIYLNATVLGLSKKQVDQKFDDIVAFSELGRFIDQKVKNYSSGMSVRLAFSVAIHANRDILLMDEVLAVGDTNFQSKCFEEFNKYRDQGKTVILVTHDIPTVQRYCDRAMLLRNGKIELIGNPEKVGNKYIFQNMSDEEKRIIAEEKRQREKAEREAEKQRKEEEKRQKALTEQQKKERKEVGNKAIEERKIAKITKVEFLNKNGKVKNVFRTGSFMSIRVYFKTYKKKKSYNFGFGIYSSTGEYMCGLTTVRDKFNTRDSIHRGYFQIDFEKIPLRPSSFFVEASIVGNNFSSYYDFIRNESNKFRVFSSNENKGLVELSHKWK